MVCGGLNSFFNRSGEGMNEWKEVNQTEQNFSEYSSFFALPFIGHGRMMFFQREKTRQGSSRRTIHRTSETNSASLQVTKFRTYQEYRRKYCGSIKTHSYLTRRVRERCMNNIETEIYFSFYFQTIGSEDFRKCQYFCCVITPSALNSINSNVWWANE